MFDLEIARMRGLIDSLVVIIDGIDNPQIQGSATFLITELKQAIDELERMLKTS
jgi:hypothetical protein